jgi:lipopolysaccharide transport system ATP-binding protein
MSSSDIAISVRGLSKSYTIAHDEQKHSTLAETLLSRLKNPLRRPQKETFWALKDVNFDIKKGEVVGIIGRNGAGKSTLLKILSRITEPTSGQIDLYGRVGSLLEVGTGFHPELTGRENIYLNGAILGMKRSEIRGFFDEIVEFAGVNQFLDTPVKRFSSGMYVRLAFAVAAFLESHITVVDEVLAVGDAEFQEKCLGKMRDMSRSGRTVLFVSHNMTAIRSLCSQAILLSGGKVVQQADVETCIRQYSDRADRANTGVWERNGKPVTSSLIVQSVHVAVSGRQPDLVLDVCVKLRSVGPHRAAFIALDISDASGTHIMQPVPSLSPFIADTQKDHEVRIRIDLPPLIPGNYLLGVWVGCHNTETYDEVNECVSFEVRDSPTKGRTYPHSPDHGYIVPRATLEYQQ